MSKKKTSDSYWAQAVQPIVDACAANPGMKAEIIREMNRLAVPAGGKPWNRQQIEAYLHATPSKRQEPRLGAGLVLIDAHMAVINAMHSKKGAS